MLIFLAIFMFVIHSMLMGMILDGVRLVRVIMLAFQMHIKFHSFNAGALLSGNVEMVFLQPEFSQFMLELGEIDPQIQQRPKKHVSTNPAENVEVNGSHKKIDSCHA